jgi:hypothetical protein
MLRPLSCLSRPDAFDAGMPGASFGTSGKPCLCCPPNCRVRFAYLIYDLLKGGYTASNLFNEQPRHYQVIPRRPEDYFSPAALAAEGIR